MKIIKQLFNNHPGILILPDDYLSGDPVPLIVFDAGVGEHPAGANMGTVDLLYNNGSPLALARDGKLNGIIHPDTGKSVRWAVIGLQGQGWCVTPQEIAKVVRQLFIDYPTLDKKVVFKTGLSAGGQNSWQAVTDPVDGSLYTAAVPMSTPQCAIGSKLACKVWAQHGTSDSGITDAQYDYNLVASVPKGWAFYTGYPGGHGGWQKQYDPGTRYLLPGYNKPVNVYEFALMVSSNPSFLFTASGVPSGATGTIQPTMSTSKAVAKVTANGRNITLNSAGSVNAGGYDWQAVDPSGKNRGWLGLWGGKDLADKQWTVDQDGDWQFILTVTDAAGNKLTDTAKVTVGAAPVVTTPPPVATAPPITDDPIVQTFTVNIRKSGKKEII